MQPLADQIGHPADCQDVATAIERNTIFKAQSLTALDLVRNRLQLPIIGLKGVPWTFGNSLGVHHLLF